jgi:rhodanese-related sulfurtransferase
MEEISVTEANQLAGEGVALIDVREQHEWASGHAPTAIHIPLGELPARVAELPEGPLLMVCKVGGRSAQAAGFLESNGRQATNVAGGMDEWKQAGLPTV